MGTVAKTTFFIIFFCLLDSFLAKGEEEPGDLFARYVKRLCSICSNRREDCGCDETLHGSAGGFRLLHEYALKYEGWAEEVRKGRAQELRFVVADVTGGGFGNQIFQAIQGLLVALELQMPLVVMGVHTREQTARLGMTWHPNLEQHYVFNAVLPLIDENVLEELRWREGRLTKMVYTHDAEGIEFLTCRNWHEEAAGYQFLRIHGITDVHMAELNVYHGRSIKEAFRGKTFFWLSHFLWDRDRWVQEVVQVETSPPAPWDGLRTVQELGTLLPASPQALRVGLHLRLGGHFLHFDHRHAFKEGSDVLDGLDPLQFYCGGHANSVKTVGPCLRTIIARHGEGHERIVVLWSSDNGRISERFIEEVVRIPHVSVVRILHKEEERYDHPEIRYAMADVALVSLSEMFLGTALSSFSFYMHASSLIVPYYMGHVPGSGCKRAASSEAGLVTHSVGSMHVWSSCFEDEDEEGGRERGAACEIADKELEETMRGCTAVFEIFRHNCLQRAVTCVSDADIKNWSSSLNLETDMGNFYNLRWSRDGLRWHYLVPDLIDCHSYREAKKLAASELEDNDRNDSVQEQSEVRSRQDVVAEESDSLDRRFKAFAQAVCQKCKAKQEDCGCEELLSSDPFFTLHKYASKYEEWSRRQDDREYMNTLRWVVVDVNGGIGNQLLQAVLALMIAIRTDRVLVVNLMTPVEYNLSHVLPLLPLEVPASLGWPRVSTREIATDHRDGRDGVQFWTCGDWRELDGVKFLHMMGLSDVHLPLLHPVHGWWFSKTFRGKPFFFLSYLLWTGEEMMEYPVVVKTFPRSQLSGPASMQALVAKLRHLTERESVGILAVHMRMGGYMKKKSQAYSPEAGKGDDFLLFSHKSILTQDWDGEGLSPLERYCLGDEASLQPALACLGRLVEQMRSSQGKEKVLLLWATERADMLEKIAPSFSQVHNVTILKVSPDSQALEETCSSSDVMRRRCHSLVGLTDFFLLTQVHDVFVGTAHSTYTYCIHSRSLSVPVYVGLSAGSCSVGSGHQAGLFSRGSTPAEEQVPLHSQLGDMEVDKYRNCTMGYYIAMHGCMEEIATCVTAEQVRTWAAPLLIGLNHVELYEQLCARVGWRGLRFVPSTGIVCSEILDSHLERLWGEEGKADEHTAEGGKGGV
ncbi:hypothetical protein GUITHDRAFT_120380 [Guillardia theta CCMP2712]|uniref:Uncharacterized protein n=1 Tax=Guillardia theta (strain CCMP2712) TaxID=905079 RepID=L1IC62_GUITC|nr:hypothetical protein GUITHDRAFT_120380 [Guillardia theta CCMP2712]EKX33430.1 hypothetical protein GUITHDRAFT_120380 [Guillardia theta CCMP2712]|eukprot:XP_005820410.1 hypothetical protein GUITHDRAFT_120380 [Guillardia theta CCMP2712]